MFRAFKFIQVRAGSRQIKAKELKAVKNFILKDNAISATEQEVLTLLQSNFDKLTFKLTGKPVKGILKGPLSKDGKQFLSGIQPTKDITDVEMAWRANELQHVEVLLLSTQDSRERKMEVLDFLSMKICNYWGGLDKAKEWYKINSYLAYENPFSIWKAAKGSNNKTAI